MRMGPDNALYVSYPAFGALPPIGGVDLACPQPMAVSPELLALDLCDVVPPSSTPPSSGMPDMGNDSMAFPESGGSMVTPDTTPAPAEASGKDQTGAQAVSIQNVAFNPGTYVHNCSYHPNMPGTIVVK